MISIVQGFFCIFCISLAVLSLILAEQGEIEQADELYATVLVHPVMGNSRFMEGLFGRRLSSLAESLPIETLETARARGRSRDLFETGREYLEKLRSTSSPLNDFTIRHVPSKELDLCGSFVRPMSMDCQASTRAKW